MSKAKPLSKHKWIEVKESGSLVIRFNYQGKPYKFAPVTGGRYDNSEDIAIANRVASEIEQAVKLGKFEGLEQWKPRTLVEKVETHKPLTLLEVWQQYKLAKADKVSKSSQLSIWQQTDRCLHYLIPRSADTHLLDVEKITLAIVIKLLLGKYSTEVITRVLANLHAACNFAVKRKLIEFNPLVGYKDYLPDRGASTRSKECYSHDEALLIINAFRTSTSKAVSHYTAFVEFLFLTGVRPQLAIALTWGDVKADKIIFNKGFTHGELTKGKTGRVTHYPLYPQLKELVDKIYRWDVVVFKSDLVFPGTTENYISLKNFTARVWKPLITDLITQGKLIKYLPTYHCRHSAATFLAKAGLPSITIAALLDTSETMLNKHYFDNQELTNVVIPDLLSR